MLGAAFLLLGIGLGVELGVNYFNPSAIVITGETDIRNGPFDEAPSLYKVRDGAELTVLTARATGCKSPIPPSPHRLGASGPGPHLQPCRPFLDEVLGFSSPNNFPNLVMRGLRGNIRD